MITIQVKVTGHELSLVSSPILSSDSIQFDRINFQFDSNWDGFNKVALFWGGDSDTPYGSLVDENNNATIPAEVIAEKGTIRFGVYGEDPEDLRPRITSTILKYKVREGTWSDAVAGDDELTETLIDQLKEIAYAAYGNAEQFIEDAQEYLTQARTETAQNIAQNNAAVAANIQQNNAAVAANIQQNNAAITEYIADARETTQEYLDEVTEMAEGAKDSAKVAAQAAIDAAAPCLTYSTLYEQQSGGPVIQKVGDSVSVEDVGDYDYLDIMYSNTTNTTEYSKMQTPVFANYKRFALEFGNNNYIDLPVTLEFPHAYIDSNASSQPNRSLMINAVLRVNRAQDTITFIYAIDETFTYSQSSELDDVYINVDSNIEGLPNSFIFNVTKIIGWKYSNVASKQLLSHDPELLDVRIAADGTIYASAGDAVRDQIEEAEEIAFASYPARETSGATVSFLDGGDNAPVKELEVDISSVSGVTGASVERLGKNLANVSDNTYTNSGITFTISDGAVQMAGTSTATINRTIGTVKLLAGVTYVISGTKSSGISDADVLRVDLRTSGGSVVASGDSYNGFTYTPNADTNAQVNIRLASGQTLDTTIYPQIEIGSIATEFEPYSPTVYTVDWTDEAGSIQSGTLDVLDGKLTVNGTTYDITPVDVRTLLGSNTFSADCGDISMVYRADPALSLVEKYEKPSTGIPKTDLAADVQTSLGKADTALQSAPVTSVAGKTGAVTLDGGDVGYSVGSTYSSGTVGKSLQNTENGLALLQQTVDQLGGDKIPFDFSGYVPSEESIADVVNEISDDVTDLKSQIINVESVLKDGTYTSNTYYRGVRNASNPTNIGANNARCTSVLFSLDAGDTIAVSGIDNGKKFVIAGAVSPTYDSGWKTSDFAYTALKTGLYFVNFAMSDGTSAIVPTDISATITVSKNDILPIINKNDIAKLQEDLDTSVKNTVMQFPYVSGTGHSSNADKVTVDIKEGQSYYIKSEQSLAYLSVYAWYADGTNALVLSSSNNIFETCLVAANDITALSVYFSAPSTSGTFTMTISYGFKREIVDLQKRAEEVGTVRSRVIEYTSGAAHSASKDKCMINIRAGEKYLLSVDSEINTPLEVYGYYGNNQGYSAGNVSAHSDTIFVATQDLFGVGVYFSAQETAGTCTITVRTGSEIDLYNLQNKSDDVIHRLPYAKHVAGNAGTALTLLHISDIHAESNVLTNILADASKVSYDDAICTGDLVGGTYTQITSWWPPEVLTCIGNHDTATYDASTGYDWTALSMADRDAYYIAPFESGWGITHTSGTSYYYKDYAAFKVRLIVMDAMLYTGTPGAEATAQTAWLSGLLTSAISGNLHVLIAIHSPHGGATAKDCSFTRYGQDAMPTLADCNTPQTVIDAVATAISNGLHFIGYICGHTHQDNIWNAEGDGKQLMYCITCAALTEAQWKNSDQYRNINNNAYNLITIDTTNTLIKIIRGGGADIDDHMRAREAVCFNYSTGQVVGEIH